MNNKVAIITRHAIPNYGSFFQAFSTEKVLSQLGYGSEIIDYRRMDETADYLIKYYCKRTPGLIRWFYYNIFWRISSYLRGRVFFYAGKKYLNVSPLYNKNTISKIRNKYDIFLTGSDQVWNVVGSGDSAEIDGIYFWDFLDREKYIISYAASFGDNSLFSADQGKIIDWLSKYNAISVREDSGVSLIDSLGFSATQVLDPTLVLERESWISLASSVRKRRKPYLLVYNLHSNTDMNGVVKRYSDEMGLKVVNIISTFRFLPGENVFCPSVEQFLNLFMNAEFIIADSFHAIAFAIIFKVPFCVKLPKKFSTRLESILRMFNLTSRIIYENSSADVIQGKIDWDNVYDILEKEKIKSIEWLKKALYGGRPMYGNCL